MNIDWRRWRADRPWLFAAMVAVKRLRTKVALILAIICVAKGVYLNEAPFDLDEPNAWVLVASLLIGLGFTLRIAAYGTIRKKESLATTGVYSLCRHPLYLGSMLMTYGFCTIYDDPENFIVATAYFALFYPLTIVWEEIRLAEHFGDAHRRYAEATPLIVPIGRFCRDGFSWTLALRNGGGILVAMVASLIACTETLAELMRQFPEGLIRAAS